MDAPARLPALSLPRPRMLACDIDGTLLDEVGVLRSDVRDAIGTIRASGVEVLLATGRSPWSGVGAIAAELGLTGPQVTMQGALVSVPATGEVLRVRELAPQVYAHALRFAELHDLQPIVSLAHGHRASRRLGRDAMGQAPVESPTFTWVSDLDSLADEHPLRVYLPIDPGNFPAIRDAAVAWAGDLAAVVWSDATGLEFMAPGTHKGSAVAWLAAQRGWSMDEVAAVGDAANDRELLAMAGRSAAMGDAPPEVVACADIVVPPSNASGVLDAFAWFFPDRSDRTIDEAAA